MSKGGTRVLVTGASGLIGSRVVAALLQEGYAVRGLSRRRPAGADGPAQGAGAEHLCADVRDREAIRSAMAGCDSVIHTAALYSYAREEAGEMRSINLEGTRTVLEAAAEAGVRRVVVTSSAATCGPVAGRAATESDDPPEWELAVPYKATKLAAERAALARAAAGQDVVVVNPTTTVGPGDRRPTPSGAMILDVLRGRMRGYLPSFGLNVVAADDVARGHVLALERGRSGERYLLGGEDMSMRELARVVARLGGGPEPLLPVPYPLVLATAWALDRVARLTGGRSALMTLDEVRLARLPMYFSSAKAEAELGYRHRSGERALADAVAWFLGSAPGRDLGRRASRPTGPPIARRRGKVVPEG